MDHEVLDCPRMIANLERINLNQEDHKAYPEKAETQQELEKVLIQMKDTLKEHKDVLIIRDLQRKGAS
jgi:hypothetical protein